MMTKHEARKALTATWQFSRVGENIALRELALIEAVRRHELASAANPPSPLPYASPRPS